MISILPKLWKWIGSNLQWRILWLFHHKFIIGVSGVIVNEDNRVLLLQHRYWKEGSWGLPSGYVNSGETLEGALRREVAEETGYQVGHLTLIRLVSGYKLRLEVSYFGHLVGGEQRLDHQEVLAARFFPLQELPSGLIDSHRQLISLVVSQQLTNNAH